MEEIETSDAGKLPVRLRMELGRNAGAVDFASPLDFKEWFEGEAKYWGWLNEVQSDGYAPAGVVRQKWKRFRAEVDQLVIAYESEPNQENVEHLKIPFERFYISNSWPISTGAAAEYVGQIRKTLPRAAVSTVMHLTGMAPQDDATISAKGAVLAELFSQGNIGGIEARVQAVDRLSGDLQSAINTSKSDAKELVAHLANDRDQGRRSLETLTSDVSQLLVDGRQKLDAQIAQAKDNWGVLQTTYSNTLALQAPVQYWSKKRKHHERQRKTFTTLALVWLICSLILAAIASSHLLDKELSAALSTPLWHIALFGTLLTILVWVGRILVRIILSHVHLESDAFERATIANTMLSLLKKGVPETEVQKQLLQALVRHSSDGIVNDDAMPYLSDLIKKSSSSGG